MSQLKRSQQKASEEDRSRVRENEKGVQVCACKRRHRLDVLLLIFVAVTLSVEFLYDQINHLPSPPQSSH